MKTLVSIAFMVLLGVGASAQSTLTFCVEVGKGDSCIRPTTEFDIDDDGGTISMLVKPEDSVQTTILRYKIYYIDNYGNEQWSNTIEQITNPSWTFAWQDVVFYDPGTYKIKVYRTLPDGEKFLISGLVKLFCR
ncbi:MAG: hypothetical protein KIS94_04325 [Chitinophagales bacterium]|nr:hypothetical protein [Chitinophagales bacterium]